MAAMSSLKDLPDGYRFNPRDEDLINIYLRGKLGDIPGPGGYCLIPEIDIYKYEPQDLIPWYDKKASINSNGLECFFFCTLDKDPNRRWNNRKIADGKNGFWHQTAGDERKIQGTDKLEWAKRIFCYRLGTHKKFEQTDWVMHEFRIINEERFVLCRVTKKPKKKLSASAGEKRKIGSTFSESNQEPNPESCVLNDITTKKAKNHASPSQNDNHTPLAACSEASVHITVTQVPTITTPVSDIITLDDLDMPIPLLMDGPLTPGSDIILPYYNDFNLSPSVTMIGAHTPPLDISISDYGSTFGESHQESVLNQAEDRFFLNTSKCPPPQEASSMASSQSQVRISDILLEDFWSELPPICFLS